MKILKLTAENIKKLKVVSITPDGNIVEITGANGSGKTSVLDSIYYALAGAKDIPAQPIRRGQLKAHVTLELGEITVTRKFSKDTGTSIVVEAKNGSRFPSPQKMLDEMLGKLTFDPLAFSRMDPKKQLEQLRSMVKVDIDLDEIDRLNAADFDNRTDINRQIKSLDAQGHGITYPEDTPDEEIDLSKLVAELEEAGRKNTAIEQHKNSRDRAERKIQDTKQSAYDARQEATNHRAEIERLRRLAEVADNRAEELVRKSVQLQGEFDAMKVETPIDTNEIRTLIQEAQLVNAHVAEKKRQYKIFADAKAARAGADLLTEKMAERTNAKQKAVAAAKMPIENLSFGDGEVTYNGLPLNQASSAEQLRISVAVAMAANPKLRVLRIQDGSLLDENSMLMLSSMADSADYQIWIERVDTSGKVGIVMEDGHVKGAEAAAAK